MLKTLRARVMVIHSHRFGPVRVVQRSSAVDRRLTGDVPGLRRRGTVPRRSDVVWQATFRAERVRECSSAVIRCLAVNSAREAADRQSQPGACRTPVPSPMNGNRRPINPTAIIVVTGTAATMPMLPTSARTTSTATTSPDTISSGS